MNRRIFAAMLSTASVGVLSMASASAQAQSAQIQSTQTQVAAAPDTRSETISVYATGQTRQVQQLTQGDMDRAAPGTSPIAVLATLPGVNYESADPFGAYEWATRISVRGFSQSQLGFTLDDVPLGDMSYGNWNGLHISRAISDENIGSTVLSQGTGSLGTASTSNLGGTVQFYSADPLDTRNAEVAQTFGSNNTFRTFAKFDSGLLSSGTKFYLSYTRDDSDKWKGSGGQNYFQVNSKLVQTLGQSTFTAFLNYSERQEVDYQDMSKEYVQKLGYNWDNYYPNWQEAVNAAKGVYTHGENKTSDPLDAAYYAGGGLRNDLLGGGTLNTRLTDSLSLKTTVYGHNDEGRGLWFTPYTPSPNGSPISLRTSEYGLTRLGALSALTWENDRHKVETGVWYEHDDFSLARRFYATSLASPNQSLYVFPSDPFATAWAFQFETNVMQGYIQDTYRLTDALTVTAGFKGEDSQTHAKLTAGSGFPSGTVDASSPFLPQVGVNYKLTEDDELFADVAENIRAFQAGGPGYGASPFATTQAGFNAIQGNLKPETSWSYELGYRLKRPSFSGDIDVYHVNFSNRLLATQSGSGIQGNPSVLSNVGGVTTNGVEIAETWRFLPHFSWYNGGSFNYSSYDNNVVSGSGIVRTAGKIVVDTPKFLYKTDLGYTNNGFFAHLSGDYMSTRYYSYMNDGSVSGRMLWNIGTGYTFEQVGPMHDVKLQLNVYNLFDKQYYSSIGTNGFVNSDPNGTAQTLQLGSPREFFVTLTANF